MGTAYCLQYMHHDLNPPVAHSNLITSSIYLTDDYAAKVQHSSPFINSVACPFSYVTWFSDLCVKCPTQVHVQYGAPPSSENLPYFW